MNTKDTENHFASHLFYRLTPEIVMDALEKSGLNPNGHCRALNSLENRVFDIGLYEGKNVVAKFYRPERWSREQIQEEHDFLFDLENDEVPVITPVRLQDDQTLFEIPAHAAVNDGKNGSIYFAIWPLAGGREPAEFNDTELEITGRLLARIHNTGAGKETIYRPAFRAERLLEEPLDFLLNNHFIPAELEKDYRQVTLQIGEAYSQLISDVPHHRIHGDCHIGNLLYGAQGWYFLDFDDFSSGPAVQDIWMICPGRDAESLRRRALFLEAYRTFRDFNESWLPLIEPLRAMRYLHYAGWIARRWDDPAFPDAFPHFGTPEYWRQELNDLREQVAIIHGEAARSGLVIPGADLAEDHPEEQLSNSDYFFDWED